MKIYILIRISLYSYSKFLLLLFLKLNKKIYLNEISNTSYSNLIHNSQKYFRSNLITISFKSHINFFTKNCNFLQNISMKSHCNLIKISFKNRHPFSMKSHCDIDVIATKLKLLPNICFLSKSHRDHNKITMRFFWPDLFYTGVNILKTCKKTVKKHQKSTFPPIF